MTPRAANSVWITDGLYARLSRLATQLGLDPLMPDVVIETVVAEYVERTEPLERTARLCFVGTLLAYPGRDRWDRDGRGRRVEVRKESSRRLHLGFSRELQQRAARCGLVLNHQYVTTALSAVGEPVEEPGKARGAEPARPLTDAVLTALVEKTGPLTDGPLTAISRQLIPQQSAQRLWDLAVAEAAADKDAGHGRWSRIAATRTKLADALPTLLSSDRKHFTRLERELPEWKGSLGGLCAHLSPAPTAMASRSTYTAQTLF